MWNHDVSDTKEVERMAALYDEDGTRAVEPGAEVETGRNLVRRCGNELGIATWEVYDFDPDTWMCEAFSNREAAETWFDGHMYLESCAELDHQLTQSVKRMAALAGNMSGGRWTVGVQEYRDGRKSLSFQLSDDAGFFLITSPIGKASELAMGKVRGRVREVLADLDPYREALEACRRAENSSIALDKLAFYEKLKDVDMPVLLGALAVATEQNQRALGKLLADTRFEDMFGLPAVINPMEAAVAEAQGKLIEWKNSVHENPVAAIGSMLAEAALEHARADLEYFDQDFRERAVDGINECAVARTIAEAVPAAKPAEEEPAQSRGPKH